MNCCENEEGWGIIYYSIGLSYVGYREILNYERLRRADKIGMEVIFFHTVLPI